MGDSSAVLAAASADTMTFRHFINGEFVSGQSGRSFEKRRPYDGVVVGSVCEAGREEVAAAAAAARAALEGPWKTMSDEDRSDMLRAIADGITRRFDDFVAAEMADTGQPRSMMQHAFVPRGAGLGQMMLEAGLSPGELIDQLYAAALAQSAGNLTKAAELAGVTRAQLQYWSKNRG